MHLNFWAAEQIADRDLDAFITASFGAPPNHINMTNTHFNTPTRFVEGNGDTFAYRRWGNTATDQPPPFFLQHFRGGMDHWDPLMTDGLAAGREVILFNGRGIASSPGKPRTRIEHADLVLESSPNRCWSIGIKPGCAPTVDRGFNHAADDLGTERRLLIHLGEAIFPRWGGIEAMPLMAAIAEVAAQAAHEQLPSLICLQQKLVETCPSR